MKIFQNRLVIQMIKVTSDFLKSFRCSLDFTMLVDVEKMSWEKMCLLLDNKKSFGVTSGAPTCMHNTHTVHTLLIV